MKLVYFATLLLLLSACQSRQTPQQKLLDQRKESHEQVVEKYSVKDVRYDGLHNTFQFSSTIVTPQVEDSEWKLKQAIYQWSDEETLKNKKEFWKKHDLTRNTRVFLSFFTPSRKQNNLSRRNTKWKVYLEIDNKRYVGEIKKSKDLYEDLKPFYPAHNTWAKPYFATFSVKPTSLKGRAVKMIVTGPMGSAEGTFKK